ncbi:hypothetical protein HYS00_01495 [Candidatus Microgenomates bacterium]|nr:hypothetical protein [Candidatus Microgenomates bacterium]
MKKEVGLAIFFGVGLGLFVAFLMVFQIRKIQPKDGMVTPSPQIKVKEERPESTLQITEPKNDTITSKKTINVSGSAIKDSLVVVQSPLDESIVKATKDSFSVPFTLALGENVIQVTVYPATSSARIQQKTVTVYYLDEQ